MWLTRYGKAVRTAAISLAFVALIVVMLFWLAGRFAPKIRAVTAGPTPGPERQVATVVVRSVIVPVTEQSVGTIQAQFQTSISSRIVARVVQIDLKAGQAVKKGDLLVRLDDTDLQARLRQAESAAAAVKAQFDQATIDEKRLRSLVESNAVSQVEYDKAQTILRTTEADLMRAKQAVGEVAAVLAYTSIVSPMDGVVVDKKTNVGDTAMPGQSLLTLYDPQRMQLVANVRESLARRLTVGQEIGVRLDVLGKDCIGSISEVVPDAQSSSRTFQVKVTGPCPPGLYTGMFGRLLIPLDSREVPVIPRSAVRRVGQLEMVEVLTDGRVSRRAVRTGRLVGADCEVLSGLRLGERVVVPPTAGEPPATPLDVREGS